MSWSKLGPSMATHLKNLQNEFRFTECRLFPKRSRANYGYAVEQAFVLLTTFAGPGPEACMPSWPTSPGTRFYSSDLPLAWWR